MSMSMNMHMSMGVVECVDCDNLGRGSHCLESCDHDRLLL